MEELLALFKRLGMTPVEAQEVARRFLLKGKAYEDRVPQNKPGAPATSPGNWASYMSVTAPIQAGGIPTDRQDAAFIRGVNEYLDGPSKDPWNQPMVNYKENPLNSSIGIYYLEKERARRAGEKALAVQKELAEATERFSKPLPLPLPGIATVPPVRESLEAKANKALDKSKLTKKLDLLLMAEELRKKKGK